VVTFEFRRIEEALLNPTIFCEPFWPSTFGNTAAIIMSRRHMPQTNDMVMERIFPPEGSSKKE
jgi:hypothetical protein